MAGALKLGSLYVSLSASSSGLVKGLDAGMKAVDRFAKEVKKTSEDAAKVAASFTVLSGAALKLASGVDGPTKKAMDGVTKSTQLLAVQVADMLLPAVRQVTAMFQSAAHAVASLSPETKAAVSQFALVAVQVMAVGKAISVLASTVGPVISLLRGTMSVLTALGSGPLLGIVAAVGLVIGVVALLHRAWRKNWGGIQDSTGEVLEWLRSGFTQLVAFFRKAWDSILSGGERFVMGLLDIVETVQKVTGVSLVDTAGAREGFKGLFADLRSGAFVSEAFKFGKSVGASVVDGVKEEFALISKELGLDGLVSKVKGMFSGGSGKVIGLGRGMGQQGPVVSGAMSSTFTSITAAAEAMNALRLAVAADELAFKRHQESLAVAAVGVRQWLRSLGEGPTGGISRAGTATVSLSSQAGRAGRFGTGMTTASAKKSPVVAEAEARTRELMAGIGSIVTTLGQQLLGEVGNLVGTIAQGAQSGGVWGAIIAAIMEVAKRTESAMRFLDDAMTFVMQLATMVEPLVKPIFEALTNVLGVVLEIVAPVFVALKPLFEAIGKVVDYLAPVLYAIGDVLYALAPIIEFLGRVIGTLFEVLKPIFELIGGVIKVVATVILGFLIMLNNIAAALGDQKAAAESARLQKVFQDMWNRSGDQDRAAQKDAGTELRNLTDASKDAGDAVRTFTEALTNLPSGFKLAGARFAADTGLSGPTTITDPFEERATTIVVEQLTVQASNPEEFARVLRKAGERTIAQRTGNRFGSEGRGL